MACVCGHDKMLHDTERDQGWHQGKCQHKNKTCPTNCYCTSYIALRTAKKCIEQGIFIGVEHQKKLESNTTQYRIGDAK